MAEPKINVDRRWWWLEADTGAIEKAATAWRDLGTDGEDAGDDLNTYAQKLYNKDWAGDTRETYERHQKKLSRSLVATHKKAKRVATVLDNVASMLSTKQDNLITAESSITGAVSCTIGYDKITFAPKNAKQTKQVMDAITAAKSIRTEVDTALSAQNIDLTMALSDWETASLQWRSVADETAPSPFKLPPDVGGTTVIQIPGGPVIVSTGTADEKTKVTTRPDGTVVVIVDGKEHTCPPGTPVVVRGGKGDDTIDIAPGTDTDVTVVGGAGKDTITAGDTVSGKANGHNTILGGAGNDEVLVNGDGNEVSTGAGDDEVRTFGNHNHISTGSGDDKVPAAGGNAYVSAGRGDDTINIGHGDPQFHDKKPSDGSNRIYGSDGDDYLNGGSGDDVIDGGSGDDEVYAHGGEDQLFGGDGYDYIDGQAGNDYIDGGDGTDTIYGLDGDDDIHGGSDKDYLEGADGSDHIDGGTGDDVVSGGRGEDHLYGADGDDVIYGGDGKDDVYGGDGTDKTMVQTEDGVIDGEDRHNVKIVDNSFMKVEGSQEFQDRIRADLDMLSGSENGSKMLTNLGDRVSDTHHDWKPGEREIVIHEYDEDNGSANPGSVPILGSDVSIHINPEYDSGDDKPPSTVLYHELAHGYDYLNDSQDGGRHNDPNDPDFVEEDGKREGAKNGERQAAGLPIDHDHDKKTPTRIDPDHPYEYTENGLREEMGWGHRDHYGTPY
jgi:Ca2+-binding RTX toxin-like protein